MREGGIEGRREEMREGEEGWEEGKGKERRLHGVIILWYTFCCLVSSTIFA